jgi:hypothetical protein
MILPVSTVFKAKEILTSSCASASLQSVYTLGTSPDLTPIYIYLSPLSLLGPASAQGRRETGPSRDMRLG